MDYDRGLEVLLSSTAARRAVITDALVVSSAALRHFPDAVDRRLDLEGGYPIRLGDSDPFQVRRTLGRAQRVTARDPSLTSSGNNNKRISLWLGCGARVTAETCSIPTPVRRVSRERAAPSPVASYSCPVAPAPAVAAGERATRVRATAPPRGPPPERCGVAQR